MAPFLGSVRHTFHVLLQRSLVTKRLQEKAFGLVRRKFLATWAWLLSRFLFCCVLPPSALKQPSRNRAITPWRLPCRLAGSSFPTCAFCWSTPETSGADQANSLRQPLHTPSSASVREGSTAPTLQDHPPSLVKGPSCPSSSVLL